MPKADGLMQVMTSWLGIGCSPIELVLEAGLELEVAGREVACETHKVKWPRLSEVLRRACEQAIEVRASTYEMREESRGFKRLSAWSRDDILSTDQAKLTPLSCLKPQPIEQRVVV